MNKNKSYKWIEKKPGTYNYVPQKIVTQQSVNKLGVKQGTPLGNKKNNLFVNQMNSQMNNPMNSQMNNQMNNKINNQYSNQFNNNKLNNIYGLTNQKSQVLRTLPIINNANYDSSSSSDDRQQYNNNNRNRNLDLHDEYMYDNVNFYDNKRREQNYAQGKNYHNSHNSRDTSESNSFCSRKSCVVCLKARRAHKINNPRRRQTRSNYRSKSNICSSKNSSSYTNSSVETSIDAHRSRSMDNTRSESCSCSRCKKKNIAKIKLKQKIMKKFGNKMIITRLDTTYDSSDIKCDNIKCGTCYG